MSAYENWKNFIGFEFPRDIDAMRKQAFNAGVDMAIKICDDLFECENVRNKSAYAEGKCDGYERAGLMIARAKGDK